MLTRTSNAMVDTKLTKKVNIVLSLRIVDDG